MPWPVVISLLISNGWFLRPVGFDQRARGVPLAVRQRNAVLRIPFFIAAWVAAFTFLPLWVAVLLFAGWVTKVTPGIRRVHQLFQNVGPDESPA